MMSAREAVGERLLAFSSRIDIDVSGQTPHYHELIQFDRIRAYTADKIRSLGSMLIGHNILPPQEN